MERNSGTQVLVILALIIGIAGLSIGFAAFSNTLNINPAATVSPDQNTFNVDFSSSNTEVATSNIIPVLVPTTLTASEANINNTTDPTISNLQVVFKSPGEKATYSFYAANIGEYDAFLKSIVYENVEDGTSNKVCTAVVGSNATDAYVANACDDIVVKVKVGSEDDTTGSVTSITNHKLTKNEFEPIIVTIEYLANGDRADGDFTVSFGDIKLNYSSVD